jgi:ribonuclease J
MIMVDCGQMLPGDDMPGVDSVIPDMAFVRAHERSLKAIWITHAHEDHIGALPYVLPMLRKDIPVYVSEFARELLKEKLREYRLEPNFVTYEGRRRYRLGTHFEVEPIAVTHSMVDSFSAAIRTPAGVAIHSGDYKMDPSPPDGVAFDHYAFARYSEEEDDGVLVLLNDSTNVDRRGSCPSEAEVVPKLSQLVAEAKGTVILSCFASSVHRLQTVMRIAAANNRVVFPAGMNMERIIRVARELEILDVVCDYRDDLRGVESVPRARRMILTTGSQGEPLSALSRIALGSHRHVKVTPGDTVIMSARMIPGNERAIYNIINNLSKAGAIIHDERSTPGIHVSGHGYRDDVKHMINLTNPQFLIPVHGEHRQLISQRNLAIEVGMEPEEVLIIENGDAVQVSKKGTKIIGKVVHGRVLVDGKGIGDVGEVVLRDRRHLAEDGMVLVTVAIDHETGEIVSGPDIISRGFVYEDESRAMLDAAKQIVVNAIEEESSAGREDISVMQATIKKALRKFFKQETERFPVILPVVLEV